MSDGVRLIGITVKDAFFGVLAWPLVSLALGFITAIAFDNVGLGFFGGMALIALVVARFVWLEYTTGESATARTERMKVEREERIRWEMLDD